MTNDRFLTAREVYQLLRDIALGVRLLRKAGQRGWSGEGSGAVALDVEGWRLVLYNELGHLDHCSECTSPEGRRGDHERWARFGTDPTQLLSQWERGQLERLLQAL